MFPRCADSLRENPLVRSAAAAAIAGRVLGGYPLIRLRHRLHLGVGDRAAAIQQQHARGAEQVYTGVVRLQGLMIKIGQTIGSYPALFPAAYIEILSRLQDAVPPHSWDVMRPVLERALGQPLCAVFAAFDPEPVAAASLAQVYRARLHDGREVAVKVLYPGIARLVRTDLRLLRLLLWLHGRFLGYSLQPIYEELARNVPLEIDLVHEAQAMEALAAQQAGEPRIVIPRVVWEHTSRRVLVMEWIAGIKVTEVARLRAAGIDVQAVADLLTDCYCRQLLVDGFFHADPHPGNLFALPGNRLAIVDFGLTKRLSPAFRQGLALVSRATYTGDQAAIVAGYQALGFAVRHGDGRDVFVATAETLRALTDPSMYVAGPEAMLALNRRWEQAVRANPFIAMPGDLTLVSRVLFLLTGVGVGMGAVPHVAEAVLHYTAPDGTAQSALS